MCSLNPVSDSSRLSSQGDRKRDSTPLNVEIDLGEALNQINSKLDKIDSDISDLKIGQVRVETKLDSMASRLTKVESSQETLVADIADLKGAKSLIVPIIVAVTVSLLTLVIRAIPIAPSNSFNIDNLKSFALANN